MHENHSNIFFKMLIIKNEVQTEADIGIRSEN